jgi:hypothetical protein
MVAKKTNDDKIIDGGARRFSCCTEKSTREQLSSKWMTFKQVAQHFCVSEATVRLGRGVFGRLRRVPLSAGRVVVPRSDVDKLDRELERRAVALSSPNQQQGKES